MKKVLVGICGIGNGHIDRQSCIIEDLIKRDVQIVIATTKDKMHILDSKFPNIKKIKIKIPWIYCNYEGIDYKKTIKRYKENNENQFLDFFNFAVKVESIFKGKPDLIITDYEPNVAQYSYSTSVPLICMEQQAKFIYLNEEDIPGYSIREEINRLNYFFPKYDLRIISSFFPISVNNPKVIVTPPIISNLNVVKDKNKIGLVYFSPYSDSKKYFAILKLLSKIKDLNFIVYSKLDFPQFSDCKNLTFKKYGDGFREDLENAQVLVATSGHQLISEAVSLNIPIYTFPLETYEQNYNCLMVEKYKIGKKAEQLTVKEFLQFYKNIEIYHNNIISFKRRYYKKCWNKIFDEAIEKFLANNENK